MPTKPTNELVGYCLIVPSGTFVFVSLINLATSAFALSNSESLKSQRKRRTSKSGNIVVSQDNVPPGTE